MEILKEYVEREEATEEQAHLSADENELYECVNAAVIEPEELDEAELDLFEKGQTESYRDVDVNPDLSVTQKWQVQRLIEEFQEIFTDKIRGLSQKFLRKNGMKTEKN